MDSDFVRFEVPSLSLRRYGSDVPRRDNFDNPSSLALDY